MKHLIIKLLATTFIPFSISKPFLAPSVQTEEVFAYNQMIEASSSINGNEVNPMNSGNKNVSYGFYHGSVQQSNISKFSKVLPNNIGTFGESTTFFANWRMGVMPGDNLIIKFSSDIKTTFSTFRNKLGADFREDLTLNIYTDSELVYTHDFVGAGDKTSDFSYTTTLEANSTLYYELVSTGDSQRHISMETSGSDFSSLPTFKFSEYIEENPSVTSFTNMFNGYKNKLSKVTSTDGLYKYGFYSGSIVNKNLTYLTLSDDKLVGSGVSVSSSNVSLQQNSSFTLRIDAVEQTSVTVQYPNATLTNENGMTFRAFKYNNSKSKTKQQYSREVVDQFDVSYFGGRFALLEGETLYLEFKANSNNASTSILPSIRSARLIANYNDSSNFPKYEPTDFSNSNSIDHKTLAFESARIKCDPVKMQKINISMLEGTVNVDENNVDLEKYQAITYEDGNYLESNESPKMMLSDVYGVFDGAGYAAVEDYRLKTSVTKSNVFKIEAKENVAVNITHPDLGGGWVDVNGQTYFASYLQTNNKLFQTFYKDLTDGRSPANTFANVINLKAGDVGYFVFGTRVATQRNVNIRFTFDTNSAFDEEAYKQTFGDVITSVDLINAVTDVKNNNCDPVTYDGNLEIGLMHGNQKEYEKMNPGVTNDGQATDVLFAGNGENDNLAMFYKWQIRAGRSNDNAVMIFKALNNIELVLTHDSIDDTWATSSSIKYFARSSEGHLMFLTEKYVEPDTVKNHYGGKIQLRSGEALILVYSSNDEQGTGTVDMLWNVTANPKTFNEAQAKDFSEARRLEEIKESKLQILLDYYHSVNESDYSIINYLYFNEYIESYQKEVETLTSEQEIVEVFNKYYAKMQAIKTITQEEAYIANLREEQIKEAKDYMQSLLSKMNADNKTKANSLFNKLVEDINVSTSETEIKLLVKRFKNNIDELIVEKEKGGCKGSVIATSGVLSLTSLSMVILLLAKKKEKENE